MSTIVAALLGLIQGLTEFLPVSSSGHLVLGAHLFGLTEPHILFDLALHMGTLIACVTFFWSSFRGMVVDGVGALGDKAQGKSWRDVWQGRPNARLLLLVIVASIPTALFGLIFKDQLEAMFGDARATAIQLLITAALLFVTQWGPSRGKDIHSMSFLDASIIGLVQGIAIVPGISRSGSTIAAGLLLGLDRELAARFSFVMSVPAIAGAFVLKALEASDGGVAVADMVVGFLVAGVSGFLSLMFLMPVVRRGRIYLFALYLVPLAFVWLWFLPS